VGRGNLVVHIVESVALASLLPDSAGGWIALTVGVIGLAAAVQQLTAAFFRRKYGKAEERVLDILKEQIDAEEVERFAASARKQAAEYESLQERLRLDIAQQIPLEAERMYLDQRIEALIAGMGRDHQEYLELNTQLDGLEARSQSVHTRSALSPELQEFLQDSVVPQHMQVKKRERQLLLLVGATVVLALTPVSLGLVLINWITVLVHPLTADLSLVILGYACLGLLVTLLVMVVKPIRESLASRIARTGRWMRLVQFVPALLVAMVLMAAAGLWYEEYQWYDISATAGEQANAVAYLFFTTVPAAFLIGYLILLAVQWFKDQAALERRRRADREAKIAGEIGEAQQRIGGS
jgi:hypothetical protein